MVFSRSELPLMVASLETLVFMFEKVHYIIDFDSDDGTQQI